MGYRFHKSPLAWSELALLAGIHRENAEKPQPEIIEICGLRTRTCLAIQ